WFQLTSETGGNGLPFTLGYAFKKGEVSAGANVIGTIPDLQVIGKNWWPDGSLKFAIISGRANLAAATPQTINLMTGTPSGAAVLTTNDLKSTGITAVVGCGGFGTVT